MLKQNKFDTFGIKESPKKERHPAPPPRIATCEHKFVHFETFKSRESGIYQTGWKRVDRFFCEKCLEYKDVEQMEWSRDKPIWY